MSGLPHHALEQLRASFEACPDVLRATWQSSDRPRLVVALDRGSDDVHYQQRAREISTFVLPVLAGTSSGFVCGPDYGVAASERGGQCIYERSAE